MEGGNRLTRWPHGKVVTATSKPPMKMLAWSRWHSACLVFALMVARTYGDIRQSCKSPWQLSHTQNIRFFPSWKLRIHQFLHWIYLLLFPGKQTAKHVIFVAIDGFQLEPNEITEGKTWSTFQQNGAYNLAANQPTWQAALSGNELGFRNMFEVQCKDFVPPLNRKNVAYLYES